MNPTTMVKRLFLLVVLLALLLATAGSAGAIASVSTKLYVTPSGTSANSCVDWTNACDLQTAIGNAVSGDQIWVAAGTYRPTLRVPADSIDPRTVTFTLKDGVAIYGGFAGGETDLSQRNWSSNVTILSGDLSGDDAANFANRSDNAYNVVTIPSAVSSGGLLDGFTIRGGNANGSLQDQDRGGGVQVLGGSPTLANLTVTDNQAKWAGGGVQSNGGAPALTNVRLLGNKATNYGGGMYSIGSSGSGPVVLMNVIFSGNSAPNTWGGGLYAGQGAMTLTNVVFSGNYANVAGGMAWDYSGTVMLTNVTFSGNTDNGYFPALFIYTGTTTMVNSIVWDNTTPSPKPQVGTGSARPGSNGNGTISISYSDLQGGCPGTVNDPGITCASGNIDISPFFVSPVPNSAPTTGGDLHLSAASPAIDAGNNSAVPADVTTDLGGHPRRQNDTGTADTGSGSAPVVDMGAYEFQGTTASVPDLTVAKSHVGSFRQGQTGAQYTITVTNSGLAATSGSSVAVTDTLPTGLTATAVSGDGWACTLGTLTCTRSDSLAPRSGYPTIVLTVSVASNAAASVTNTVAVSGVGESNTSNDTATDFTSIAVNNPPTAPATPSPADTAIAVPVSATLSWAASTDPDTDNTVSHRVYLDTSGDPSTLVCDSLSAASCDPTPTGDLVPSTTYRWKVVASDNYQASTTGPIWSFTTDIAGTPPVVTIQPSSQTVVADGTATFTTAASGTPLPTVQWQVSTNGGKKWSDVPGATSPTLTFTAPLDQNGYQYRAVFTNSAGRAVSNTATLTVTAAPAVTTQPSNQSVAASGTATFTAAASGNPAPTVQWQVSTNGGSGWSDLSGATSTTLSVGPVNISMSGYQYKAVFANTEGSISSDVATLTVTGLQADLSITKQGTYDSATNKITWTVTVHNGGPTSAEGVQVTDNLAKGTKLYSTTATSYKAAGSRITVTLGTVTNGSDVSFQIVESLSSRILPPVENTATVTSTTFDNNLGNNTVTPSVSWGP